MRVAVRVAVRVAARVAARGARGRQVGSGERRMGVAEPGLERRAGSAVWSLGAGMGGGPPVRAEVQGSLVGVFELGGGSPSTICNLGARRGYPSARNSAGGTQVGDPEREAERE